MPISATHEKYANFYTDFAFKKLFGTEANKECLIGFLNSLFDGEEEILDVTYRESQKQMWDLYSVTTTAEKKGMKKGLEQGIVKGRAEGRAEGEHNKAVDIAKKLLASGLDVDFVAQNTGLPAAELRSIL